MKFEDLKKAEEIRQQIEQLEKFINHKQTPLEEFSIIRQKNKFRLSLITRYIFSEQSMIVTSEILSDAIKDALKLTIEDLKSQLTELGVEVEEDSE